MIKNKKILKQKYNKIKKERNYTFAIHTLGCKANNYDSECVKSSLISSNFYLESFKKEKLGIYIINTCAVTNVSESKSKKYISRACKNKNSIIVVMGCFSQIKSKEILDKYDVDIVIGTENKSNILKMITNLSDTPITSVTNVNQHEKFQPLSKYFKNTRGFIKIQDGCNNFCTFCIIPYTRGKLRSRDSQNIIHEIQQLVNSGHKEIVLTGIHTAGYGEELENYSFAKLLIDIENNVKNIKRLRISSIEASQVSKEILSIFKNSKILVPHLHIPLQSGSDRILILMERMYNKNHYLGIINEIKKSIPNIAITTDIIVGFPNETESDFNEAYNFCKEVGYSEMHVFPYSKKDNTPAAEMKQVNDFIKRIRVTKMLDLNKELAIKYVNSNLNNILNVLFEYKTKDDYYIGYTENYIKIKCKSSKDIKNEILPVKIIKSDYPISEGKILNEKN